MNCQICGSLNHVKVTGMFPEENCEHNMLMFQFWPRGYRRSASHWVFPIFWCKTFLRLTMNTVNISLGI